MQLAITFARNLCTKSNVGTLHTTLDNVRKHILGSDRRLRLSIHVRNVQDVYSGCTKAMVCFIQYLSLDRMRIGKLYHLAVDVVFSQSLPGILSGKYKHNFILLYILKRNKKTGFRLSFCNKRL